MPKMDDMGVLNKVWGICGFTSVMYAVYKNTDKASRPGLADMSDAKVMLAEILRYLELLTAGGGDAILKSIEDFTKSFGGTFATFKIVDYMQSLKAAATSSSDLTKQQFSVAMPPAAVVDYLKRGWNFNNAQEVALSVSAPRMIIGVRRADTTAAYGGLRHYIYNRDSKFYSWGNQYGSIADAMMGGTPPYVAECCRITF